MHVAYNERITRKRFFRVQVQLNCEPIAAVLPIAAAGAKARPCKTTIRGGQTYGLSARGVSADARLLLVVANSDRLPRRRAFHVTINQSVSICCHNTS